MRVVEDGDAAREALARADAAYSALDLPALVAHLSAAVRGFTAAGDACMAAMACVRLGDVYANALGNQTAGRAWFARARRLVADQPPCLEQGWAAVAAMGCDVDDPETLLADAELALDRARRFGDVNLETKALADAGLARVQLGDVATGMAMIDEAMALACGPADDRGAACKSVCSFFTACYVSGDYDRVGSWRGLLAGRGFLASDNGPEAAFLSSHCDSVQAALLVGMGRWDEAEQLLVAAIARFEEVMGEGTSWHPAIGLAELRIRQGRLDDAERLLLGKDGSMEALLPWARLHLARGDLDLARTATRRGLRSVGNDVLRAIELLATLVEIEVSAGDLPAASLAAEQLAGRARSVHHPAGRARADTSRARLLAASGDTQAATAILEQLVEELDPRRMALDHQTAAAELERIRAPEPPAPSAATLRRRGTGWEAAHDGVRVQLGDTKGLRYLALLIASPGAERHALDLVDRVEGVDASGVDRRALGDAGPALDARARAAYRHRVEALRTEIDDALGAGMLEHAESLQDELDRLVRELAAAFGLGGRERREASVVERARLNVTRAIRASIGKIADSLPDAGAALDRAVRTGTYCSYQPPPDDLPWIVQSGVNGSSRR